MSVARPKNPRDRPLAETPPTRIGPVVLPSSVSEAQGSRARSVRESDPHDLPVPVGEVIDDKYRVDRLVGTGGMGIVVAAHDVMLDRPVAVKFLHGLTASTLEANSRFKREARAMAKLHSEHVVHVLDVGTLPSGEPYMVMEYLEGTDLGQLVKQRGYLPVTDAVDYILSACEAVAEAHTQGIIHRDLKPSNLYLAKRRDGTSTLKLLDFGIAKIATDTSEYAQSFTTTTALLGSPVYMSPEQLQCSRDADERADIWSLGAIVYRLVSGRPPFAATTMPQLCTLIMTTSPQHLTELVADVPPGLSAAVMRCLEKNADDRFENVAELARALAPFGSGRSQRSVERALEIVYSTGGAPPVSSPGAQLPPARISGPSLSARSLAGIPSYSGSVHELKEQIRSRTLFFTSLGAGLALAACLGLVLWLRGRSAAPRDDGSFSATTAEVATQTPPAPSPSPAPPPPSPPTSEATPAPPPSAPPSSRTPSVAVSALPAAPPQHPWTPHQRPPRQHVDVAPAYTPPPLTAAPPPPAPPSSPPPAPADNSEFGGRK
jgi:eukaryotic-like serine/threonine-protein kinase